MLHLEKFTAISSQQVYWRWDVEFMNEATEYQPEVTQRS